ncbi:Protein O-mannosyltransferase 2 [Coemansia sp. RSA 2673]|nr:Protein O-mannosyltransferase 2 [Coemansia sp. RSA 2673]
MHQLNSMLVGDSDLFSPVESSPLSWPFLTQPMPLVAWSEDQLKYMLIGNPVLWWTSALVCIFIHPHCVIKSLVVSRRSHDRVLLSCPNWAMHLLWNLWAIHYLPFFALSRVTYLHHYLPALYFALILLAVYVHRGALALSIMLYPSAYPKQTRRTARYFMMTFVAVCILGHIFVYPLTFGTTAPCQYTRYLLIPMWRVCQPEYTFH